MSNNYNSKPIQRKENKLYIDDQNKDQKKKKIIFFIAAIHFTAPEKILKLDERR